MQLDPSQAQARDRNAVLCMLYGRLPLVALFRATDIALASSEEQRRWWSALCEHPCKDVRTTARKWTAKLA